MTGITAFLFLLVGFWYIVRSKRALRRLFKAFNSTMHGICQTVVANMVKFSHYLSKACNVMRDFSALKPRDSASVQGKKILAYHIAAIDEQIDNAYEMFASYVDIEKLKYPDTESYDYDFSVLRQYSYEIPGLYSDKKIEYLQTGYMINVPVSYVEAVTLTREEIYD